jgi:hypothetical protein
MKRHLHVNARRPVPSGRVAHSARVLPTRACFARTRSSKVIAVRGSALPGRYARHCSPPTAEANLKLNICKLIERPPVHAIALGNHEPENCIQALATGMLLAHRNARLAATSRIKADGSTNEITAQKTDRNASRQVPLDTSPHERMKRSTGKVAGAAALCCQGSAPASPPPLTAAAFRLGLRLGSGFGKAKAGTLFSHRDYWGLIIRETAVAAIFLAHSLNSIPCVSRSWACLMPCSIATDHPCPFPFASRVAFLASAEGRLNLSRGGAFSGVAVLLLGTLAAVPGCIKILHILFALCVVSAFTRCPSSHRGRSVCCANGETMQWHTANRELKPAGNQPLTDRKP